MCADVLVSFVLKVFCQKAWCFCIRQWFLKLFFFATTQTWSTCYAEVRDFTELWPTFFCFIVVIPFGFFWDLLCAKKKNLHYVYFSFYLQWCTTIFNNITFIYFIDSEWPWLTMPWEWKMQSSVCFLLFCMINLKITFYCMFIYIYIYIQNIYI